MDVLFLYVRSVDVTDDYEKAWQEAETSGFADEMRENLKKMEESALVMSIAHGGIDIKFAAELGYAIWLDKPIVVINIQGDPLPEKVRLVADRVIDVDWTTEEAREQSAEKVGRAIAEMREQGVF